MDKMTKEKSDLNLALSDTTNRLDVTERDRKFLQEQLVEVQGQNDKMATKLKVSPQGMTDTLQTVTPPPINGVVRAVKPIDSVPYATISVGSADGVQKGMEFKVIDRKNGAFLGILTVDTVEPNEATGRLKGPRVQDIHGGDNNIEVRTQL